MENKSLIADAQNSVLVIVDVQERLAAAMPKGVCDRVVDQISTLVTAAKTLSVPVVVTEQYPKGLGNTVIELKSHLPSETKVIEKTTFSSSRTAKFTLALEDSGRKQVILMGMETHICVLQTALELQEQGYQVFVVEDGVSSRSKSNQYNALQRLRHAGVIITTLESMIFEWLGDSQHPEFRTLAQLIV
ncbi:hydrolase [Methylophaga sp. 42_25_T18]|nr:hydrolase [Methylophaga sp. 42_25_T18]